VTAGDPSLGIEGVLETLGSPGCVPAAGSAAALAGALAAAVVAKAARASDRAGTAAQAVLLQRRLTMLAEHDADALAEARRLLSAGDGHDVELGRALRHAMSVPGAIGATCADVAVLAGEERDAVLPDHRPDLEAAAALAAGAAHAAAHLVAVNLAATPDDDAVTASRAAAAAATHVVAGFGGL